MDLKDQIMGLTQGIEDNATMGQAEQVYAAILSQVEGIPYEEAFNIVQQGRLAQSERTPAASMIGEFLPINPTKSAINIPKTAFERIGKNPNVKKLFAGQISDNLRRAGDYLGKNGRNLKSGLTLTWKNIKEMFGLTDEETKSLRAVESSTDANFGMKKAMRGDAEGIEKAQHWTTGLEAMPEVTGTYERVVNVPDQRTGIVDDFKGIKIGDMMETTAHEPFMAPGGRYKQAGPSTGDDRWLLTYTGKAKNIGPFSGSPREMEVQVPQGTKARVTQIGDFEEHPDFGRIRRLFLSQD